MTRAHLIAIGLPLLLVIAGHAAAGPKPGGCSPSSSGGVHCEPTTGFSPVVIPGNATSPASKACNWEEDGGCTTFDACWNELKARVAKSADEIDKLQKDIWDSYESGESTSWCDQCDALQALASKANGYVDQMSDLALNCGHRGKPLPPTPWTKPDPGHVPPEAQNANNALFPCGDKEAGRVADCPAPGEKR